MELPDGRELAWLEVGDPAGPPVFGFHGTPGSRWQMVVDPGAVVASGVRLIAVDRPGYGHSTYHEGRRLLDWPGDVSCLADHLGIDRFGVVGVSGGGPHALVCAAALAGRVKVAGVVSGVGSLVEAGVEEGMRGANRVLTRVARRWPAPLVPLMAAATLAQRKWPERAIDAMAKGMPEADARLMRRPDVREAFLKEARLASATSGRAAAQDFALFSRDWGFRLGDIAVPVHLWQGDTDKNVPPEHAARMAAAIPGAVLHELPGAGHLAVVEKAQDILETLAPLIR